MYYITASLSEYVIFSSQTNIAKKYWKGNFNTAAPELNKAPHALGLRKLLQDCAAHQSSRCLTFGNEPKPTALMRAFSFSL